MKHTAMRRKWEEKAAECRSSGMNVKAWYEGQEIDRRTYYRWVKELLEKAGQQMEAIERIGESRFVEVPALPVRPSVTDEGPALAAKLRTKSGELEIYAGVDGAVVELLLGVLKDAE